MSGAIVTLAICACLPLAAWNRKLTVYDRLSFGIVALLSVLALQKGCVNIALLAGYLGFGLMWLLSCLTKEPLCAAYVKYNYHGRRCAGKSDFYENEQNPGGWLGSSLYPDCNLVGISAASRVYGTDADLKQYGDRAHGHLYGLV